MNNGGVIYGDDERDEERPSGYICQEVDDLLKLFFINVREVYEYGDAQTEVQKGDKEGDGGDEESDSCN